MIVLFCLKVKIKNLLLYYFTFFIFSRWKSLTVKERNKTKEHLHREVCRTCAEVCPQRGYGHYCLIKGAIRLESASLLEDCTFCNKSFDCAEQMFFHCITVSFRYSSLGLPLLHMGISQSVLLLQTYSMGAPWANCFQRPNPKGIRISNAFRREIREVRSLGKIFMWGLSF